MLDNIWTVNVPSDLNLYIKLTGGYAIFYIVHM